MSKFKKFIIFVVAALFVSNAGFDITHRLQRRAVEKQVEGEIRGTPQFATSRVNGCYNVRDLGWLCDITLRVEDGRELRGSKLFRYEELSR